MAKAYSRRTMLGIAGRAALLAGAAPWVCRTEKSAAISAGIVIAGDVTAAQAGQQVLADGGNAVDAAAAAALTACVVAQASCGAGGYGGHATIAPAGEKKIVSLDYNTVAPEAARADMYPLDKSGAVVGGVNSAGWLAVGVPGTLAGIQLAVERYGTRPLGELLAPAIALAREGFPVSAAFAKAILSSMVGLKHSPGAAKILLKADGSPYAAGQLYRNPALAAMLETLAKRNSVDSFYRGDIAQRFAEVSQKNGGLVTAKDLASYTALEVPPLEQEWNGFELHTAPLTAGGLTVFQAINLLKAMGWTREKAGTLRTQGKVEALRLAWRDRLSLLGDPAKTDVPVKKLLSWDYALESAKAVEKAVHDQKPLEFRPFKTSDSGTMHISAADRHGNMAAMTLTQGAAFGSKVGIEELGIILGHGMSRFNARPGHPNSIGPGKRPLDNMCPTILTRHGRPVMALGGAGGVHIPNCIFDVLWSFAGLHENLQSAMAFPRLSTIGDLKLTVEESFSGDDADYLKSIGYDVERAAKDAVLCRVSAVTFDPDSGKSEGLLR